MKYRITTLFWRRDDFWTIGNMTCELFDIETEWVTAEFILQSSDALFQNIIDKCDNDICQEALTQEPDYPEYEKEW